MNTGSSKKIESDIKEEYDVDISGTSHFWSRSRSRREKNFGPGPGEKKFGPGPGAGGKKF